MSTGLHSPALSDVEVKGLAANLCFIMLSSLSARRRSCRCSSLSLRVAAVLVGPQSSIPRGSYMLLVRYAMTNDNCFLNKTLVQEAVCNTTLSGRERRRHLNTQFFGICESRAGALFFVNRHLFEFIFWFWKPLGWRPIHA